MAAKTQDEIQHLVEKLDGSHALTSGHGQKSAVKINDDQRLKMEKLRRKEGKGATKQESSKLSKKSEEDKIKKAPDSRNNNLPAQDPVAF